MKLIAKFFLTIIFLPLFLILVLSSMTRFQLLDTNFWTSTFEENNVYVKLASSVKTLAESQVETSGGNKNEAKILTNLITAENLKDLIERNLRNTLDFLNGKVAQENVYIPVKIIPKELLPKKLDSLKEEIALPELLNSFNVRGVSDNQIQKASNVGNWMTTLLVTDFLLILLVLFCLFLLVESGARFITAGIALIFSGVVTLLATAFGFVIRTSMLTDWVKGTEPSQVLLSAFAPYVFGKMLLLWFCMGGFAVILGVVLLSLKKH